MSNTVIITFTEKAFKAAEEARSRRNMPCDEEFYKQGGPTFKDVVEVYTDNPNFVTIVLNGIVYMYNSSTVARIKIVAAE